jgi:hypothetical protein
VHVIKRAVVWRKSRHSGGQNNCVELADLPAGVGVRDSKSPASGVLLLPPAAWRSLASEVKSGRYDL